MYGKESKGPGVTVTFGGETFFLMKIEKQLMRKKKHQKKVVSRS